MYNILRKSVRILVAGLGLLLLCNCSTTGEGKDIEPEILTLDILFTEEKGVLLYIDPEENIDVLKTIIPKEMMDNNIKTFLESSTEVYISSGKIITNEIEIIIRGNYPKKRAEFGLFMSADWKKVSKDGYKYWHGKDDLKLFFIDNTSMIISTQDITPLIKRVENNIIQSPKESAVLIMPELSNEQVKKLSGGFIKGGINDLTVSLVKNDKNYQLEAKIGLDTDRKARAFTRLLNIFLKTLISKSLNPEIAKIGDDMTIEPENESIFVRNIFLSKKNIVDLINVLIIMTEGADI